MRSRVCETVERRQSGRHTLLRRVCCCGPGAKEISIDCCTAVALRQIRAVSRRQLAWEAEHRRVTVDAVVVVAVSPCAAVRSSPADVDGGTSVRDVRRRRGGRAGAGPASAVADRRQPADRQPGRFAEARLGDDDCGGGGEHGRDAAGDRRQLHAVRRQHRPVVHRARPPRRLRHVRTESPPHRRNFICDDSDLSPPLFHSGICNISSNSKFGASMLAPSAPRSSCPPLTPNPGDATGHHHFLR